MTTELINQPIEKLAPLIRKREISPVELTQSILNQIKAHNETLNAYISVSNDDAIKKAKEAEKEILQGAYRGPLHGIPMGMKDNIYTKNQTTTMGSRIHKDFVPHYDATVIKRLKEAGVTFTGKLNLHEYALGITTNNPFFGPTRNPWDTEKIPGGSSGGGASAVASGMSVATLGTDTSGSIRIPASICGIVGLKPTYGRVSKYGVFPEAWTLDHVGPMTQTVYDAAELLRVISGFDENDPTSVNIPVKNYAEYLKEDIAGIVIGVEEEYFFKDIDHQIHQMVCEGIKKLEEMGATVKPIKISSLRDAEYALKMTDISETSTVHHYNLVKRHEDYGEDVRVLLELGEIPSAIDYLQAQQVRRRIKLEFEKIFKEVDVLIAPTLPAMPPKIGDTFIDINGKKVNLDDGFMRLIGPANLCGLPSLTLPCGLKGGLPVGMQIIGPAFQEEKVLTIGYAVESQNLLQGARPNLKRI